MSSEKGYFHPDEGYWQTTGEPGEDILNSYPDGTVEVPVKPISDCSWDGTDWVLEGKNIFRLKFLRKRSNASF